VAGLMSAAIMLVNNIRDIPTDRRANKNTLAVRLGDFASRKLYRVILVSALVLHFIVSFELGLFSIVAILLVAPMLRSLIGQILIRQGEALNIQLAKTAQLVAVYCMSVSLVFVFASY
jgi:1,4-dihydroxy-2-naphthoate octaprenyltransferase